MIHGPASIEEASFKEASLENHCSRCAKRNSLEQLFSLAFLKGPFGVQEVAFSLAASFDS